LGDWDWGWGGVGVGLGCEGRGGKERREEEVGRLFDEGVWGWGVRGGAEVGAMVCDWVWVCGEGAWEG
jgi:hypothetical protein